ncbi:hypothetical protein OUQ_1564 [Helicobacter pylori R055a]|nr:hypothetical protein OUQ_1564 [Helicobacter pylori R055a]
MERLFGAFMRTDASYESACSLVWLYRSGFNFKGIVLS